ncbi:P-type ATPase, subfamily IV, partial [Kipferlia bialata]
VTLDLVKMYCALLVTWDTKMTSHHRTDIPKQYRHASALNSDIMEDLGCIDHIFTDKTGTLTANVMTFVKAASLSDSLDKGRASLTYYGHGPDPDTKTLSDSRASFHPSQSHAAGLLTAISMCHTCTVRRRRDTPSGTDLRGRGTEETDVTADNITDERGLTCEYMGASSDEVALLQ